MKKIFFSFLAIAAIASCAKTEAVYEEGDVEIKLSPVTALQTKAQVFGAIDGTTYPTGENFDVFAYWSKADNGMFTDGELFLKSLEDDGGAEFTNRGNYWGGEVKYYWPKNGYLRFAAYSPADLCVEHQQNGDVYSIKPYVQPNLTADTWDFLVAKTSPAYSVMTATEKVAVEFEHALSWITLKVIAKDADAAQAFDIKKVTIKDVYTSADFEATMLNGMVVDHNDPAYPWTNWDENLKKDYVVFEGSQMVTETLTDIENTPAGTVVIPQATTRVVVEFDQYGVNGTADTPGMTVELDLVLDTDDTPWVPGKHYNYNLIFGLDEILINPSVVDWDEVNVGNLEPGAINVSTAAQLEAALANPQATKIVFQNDIAGTFNVPEAAKSLTIDGNGFKFDGSFCLVGNSSYTDSYTVFQNLKFTAEGAALTGDAFIYCAEQNGNTRYPDNVTIQDCTYEAAGQTAVGVKLRSLNGALVIENTTATGLHSLAQILSSGAAEAKINNVNVTDCKNGISLQYTSATISNSTIKAAEYGVRADGCVATTNIVMSTIEAKQPVIVRNVTTDGYVLNVVDGKDENGNEVKTTLTPATADDYQIIFTKASDDKPYEAPTAKFTLNAATTYKVFPTPEGWVTNAEELAAALTSDKENISIVLTADIVVPITSLGAQTPGSGEYKLGSENTRTITIDLNGHKLTIGTNYWSGLGAKNDDVLFTIKNGTMTSSQTTGTWNSYDLVFANCNYNIEGVDFEKAIAFTNATKHVSLKDVTITETHDYYAMWISAKGQNVAINGLTIESGRGIKIDEEYVNPASLVNLSVKNATFKTAKKAAILVKSVAGAAITLDKVNIADVAADIEFAVWVDEDAAAYADKVTVKGGYVKVEGELVTTAVTGAELKTDLNVQGQTVMLIPSENGESLELGGKISIAKGASLIGLGDEPVGIDNDWGSTTFASQAHFTDTHIENIFFDDNMVIDAAIANGYVSFKNCVFGGSVAHQGVHFDSGNGVVVFDNCTFVGRNMFGSSLEKVVFNNCTFLNKKSSLTGSDKWTGVNMWGKYEFNNCVFDTEATCNVKCNDVEAAFNGCTYSDGKDIKSVIRNSSNYSAVITFDGAAL